RCQPALNLVTQRYHHTHHNSFPNQTQRPQPTLHSFPTRRSSDLYDSGVSCNSSKGSATGTSHTFTANYGDVITCTFTNHRLPQVKLAKTLDPTTGRAHV